MYQQLENINKRPQPFEFYTADKLWCDPYISKQMLKYHLADDVDLSSRNHDLVKRSCEWISQRFQLGGDKTVCDFGCGPGLYTTRFAKTGARVTGVDFSQNSIEYARSTAGELGLPVEYVQENYLDFTTDQSFDLITMIFCDFCVLSPIQRKSLLTKFNGLLKPHGALLLDVVTLSHFAGLEEDRSYSLSEKDGFWSADPYYEFICNFKYEREKLFLGKYTIVEERRTREIYNWLQHYSLESLQEEFRACGLQIAARFSNVAGDLYEEQNPEMAVVARKMG
jgi:SAM-dependent methyltransferase